jgi:hypothetical protein
MQEGPKNKKEQQQPRQRKLTYVAGIEGRRYVNDKILRNLEVSQRNAFGEYIAYATPEPSTNSFVEYDPFKPIDPNELMNLGAQQVQPQEADDDYHEIHQDDLTQQQTDEQSGAWQEGAVWQQDNAPEAGRNTWDDSSTPVMGEAVTMNRAEIVKADLEAALQRAQARGSVHATYHDLSKGAFEAHAHSEVTKVEYQAHGYQDQAASSIPQGFGAGSTGDVHATHYDGYQDPAYQAVFGENAQPRRSTQEGMPGPVPVSPSKGRATSSGSREEYKKLLGGLFKEEDADAAQAAPSQRPAVVPFPEYSVPPAPPGQPDESGASQVYPEQQQPPPPAQPPQEPPAQQPSAVRSRPKPERIPVKIERVKPPLPQKRADEIYFEDNANSGKTAVFKMPKEGVVSSSRGTVELLVHKGGRMFRPHYNPVGILLRVDVSDGFSLIKGDTDKAHWLMTDRDGNPLDEEEIVSVAFDKKGNLWFETVSGKKTKFLVSGGVEVTGPGENK